MKKTGIFFVAAAMMLALIIGLVACGGNEPTEDEIIEYSPGELFYRAITDIARADNINIGSSMNLDLGAALTLNEKRIEVKGEINTAGGKIKDGYFDFSGIDAGFYLDGKDLYIRLADVGYKCKDILGDYEGESGAANGRLGADDESMLTLIGEILFISASETNKGYRFTMNVGEMMDSYLPLVGLLLGVNEHDISAFLGFDSFDAMTEAFKAVKANVYFNFSRGQFLGANVKYEGANTINLELNKFDVSAVTSEIDYAGLIPDAEYKETNLINVKTGGTFSLKEENGVIAEYDWRMIADINPFRPNENDIFHFVVTNDTARNSAEYNAEKISAKDGVVFELAYAPRQFGSDNILAAVNLKSILDKKTLTSLGVPASTGALLPDYYGFFIDIEALNYLNANGEVKNNRRATSTLSGILGMIKLDGESITLDRALADSIFSGNAIIDELLDTESANTDQIRLGFDYLIYGGDNAGYDVSSHYYNVSNDAGEKKSFGLGFKPSIKAEALETNGKFDITTALGKKLDQTNKLSPAEAGTLLGGKIKYKYIGHDGSESAAKQGVKILGVSGLDLSLVDKEQEITVLASIADGDNLSSLLNTFGVSIDLPFTVLKARITLTQEQEANVIENFTEKNYRVGDTPDFKNEDVSLKIVYSDGSEYYYDSAEAYISYLPLESGRISRAGEYTVVYNIGGRIHERSVIVEEPDGVTLEMNRVIGKKGDNIPNDMGRLIVKYGDETREIAVRADAVEFPRGTVRDGKLAIDGDFLVRVKAFGSEKITRVKVLEI